MSVVTATASPPTFFTRSPRTLKLATTWRGSPDGGVCATLGGASRNNASASATSALLDRRFTGHLPSGFQACQPASRRRGDGFGAHHGTKWRYFRHLRCLPSLPTSTPSLHLPLPRRA